MPGLTTILPFALLFVCTLVCVAAIIPFLMVLARRIGLVDRPDKRRKLHSDSTPLVGGIAILIGSTLCCSVGLFFFSDWLVGDQIGDAQKILQTIGLLVGAVVIVLVGVTDDLIGVRGRQKLFAQIVVALILVFTGTWVSSIELFGTKFNYKTAWTAKAGVELQSEFQRIEVAEERQVRMMNDRMESGVIAEEKAKAEIGEIQRNTKEIKSTFASKLILHRILAVFAVLVTILWIVGAINSVNLIDGADGLAGTTTFIISLALSIIAFYTGDMIEGAIALSLSAGILSFLLFNFPPAKIFLGDAGSMLIGLVLASLAVQSFLKEVMLYICIAPLAILFIPIFDTVTAFVRRWATGRSIYNTDRGHLHHLLLRRGLSIRGMVLFVGGLTLITATGAVLTIITHNPWFSIIGIVSVIVFLISAKIFGFAEFRLICGQLYRFTGSFVKLNRKQLQRKDVSVQLQGSREWHKLWEALTEFAERHEFRSIKLDLNLPWLHESFHADWQNPTGVEKEEVWETRVPLAVNNRTYGRMEISGVVSDESVYLVLMLLADLMENLEPALRALVENSEEVIEKPVLKSRREQEQDVIQTRIEGQHSVITPTQPLLFANEGSSDEQNVESNAAPMPK